MWRCTARRRHVGWLVLDFALCDARVGDSYARLAESELQRLATARGRGNMLHLP